MVCAETDMQVRAQAAVAAQNKDFIIFKMNLLNLKFEINMFRPRVMQLPAITDSQYTEKGDKQEAGPGGDDRSKWFLQTDNQYTAQYGCKSIEISL